MYSKKILEQSGLIEAGKDNGAQMYFGTDAQWRQADALAKEEIVRKFYGEPKLNHLQAYKDCMSYDNYFENLKNQKNSDYLTDTEREEASMMYVEINDKMKS